MKEASALVSSRYRVAIVAADIIPSLSVFDSEVVAKLHCDFFRIPWNASFGLRAARGIRQRVARGVAGQWTRPSIAIAALAHHVLTPALTAAASGQPADLYIAHNLAALPAAAAAAKSHAGKLGFDAEDYHCGELDNSPANRTELRVRRTIEEHLLPMCRHLTAASPQISAAYAADYGVQMITVLNVFPLTEAPTDPALADSSRGELPSLYWFSQTIGAARGLEEIVGALALMQRKVRLVLRGRPSTGYEVSLLRYASDLGGAELAGRIEFLPVAAPDQMVHLAAQHDLGLGSEIAYTTNRDICLTNKIFTYLLAGVPVLMNNTRAQAELATCLGCAALLVDLTNPKQVAATMDRYFSEAEMQKRARAEAWRLGRERYNWDMEQYKFLEAAELALQE